jgi:psp operon transcriptional activator
LSSATPVLTPELAELPPAPVTTADTTDFRAAVHAYERRHPGTALKANRFNQRATAAALSLSYDQLRHALKRHKLMDSEPA